MKSQITRTVTALFTLLSILLISSCTKPKDADPLYIISGPASTLINQVGPTSAIGSIKGIYNPVTHKIAYNITWANLAANAVSTYFYRSGGLPTESMIYFLPIAEAAKSGDLAGHFFLTDEQANALLSQQWNFAICTSTNSTGELHGKITVVKP
jgi:hypothetical protein